MGLLVPLVIDGSLWSAGTPYNRWHFCCKFSKALDICKAAGPLTLLDVQSVAQLLCPSFPVNIIKNAFTPALRLDGEHLLVTCANPPSSPSASLIRFGARCSNAVQTERRALHKFLAYCTASDTEADEVVVTSWGVVQHIRKGQHLYQQMLQR
jgi:hypothetical protein